METINNVLFDNDVKGIVLPISITKDNRIVAVTAPKSSVCVENITYDQAKDDSIMLLSDAINSYKTFNKRLIINATIGSAFIGYNDMHKYINLLANEINKYPDMNICVCSTNYALITYLTPQLKKSKTGIILLPENTSYIDVDLYIFPPELLSPPILNQQCHNNKEIMISIRDLDDLDHATKFFMDKKNKTELDGKLYDTTSIITEYPNIIKKAIKPNS